MSRRRTCRFRPNALWLGGTAALAVLVGPELTVAQTSEVVSTQPCVPELAVLSRESVEGRTAPPELYATCGDKAVSLGLADRHEVSLNVEANALVVSRWNNDIASIQLVFGRSDGTLHVDNVSREIAHQLGRAEPRDLSEVTVELDRFSDLGIVEVTPEPAEALAGRGSTPNNATAPAVINLASYQDRPQSAVSNGPAVVPEMER